MNRAPAAWWQRPEQFLYAWDVAKGAAQFLQLDRSTLQNSSFLDQRINADPGAARSVPVEAILDTPIQHARPDPAFIFHTAFCCSTLLARSLDHPGRTLVLREPSTLLQLADLERRAADSKRLAAVLLEPTLQLLARPFSPNERIVIKPTNLVGNIAPKIMAARPNSRAIVLYDELEPFLLSILKRPRESERGISQFLTRLLADAGPAAPAAPASLAQRAALAWWLQIRALRDLLSGATAVRMRTLRASDLIDAPAEALAASAQWLHCDIDATECTAIAGGPEWNRHAKNPELRYTPQKRREDQELARRLLSKPLAEGLAHAERTFANRIAGLPADLDLLG